MMKAGLPHFVSGTVYSRNGNWSRAVLWCRYMWPERMPTGEAEILSPAAARGSCGGRFYSGGSGGAAAAVRRQWPAP